MEIISKICINIFGGYILLPYICYIKIRYTNKQTLLILYLIIMKPQILKEAISYGCGMLTIYINNQPERVDGRKVQYSDSPEMRKLLTSQGYECKTLTYQSPFNN